MTKVLLQESTTMPKGKDGIFRIRLIGKDIQGSSGYYNGEAVVRDVPAAFPKGTRVYGNHPTASENEERPARDIFAIIGKTVSDPVEEDDGMYADVFFGRQYRQLIEDFHDVLGMSIRAEGTVEESEDESGKMVRNVTAIHPSPLNSVDVVTVAGANGAIVEALTESYQGIQTDKEVTQVEEKDIQAIVAGLTEALKPSFEALNTALVEALAVPEVEEEEADLAAVTESALEAGLTKGGRARVITAVKGGAEIAEAIKDEKAYQEELLAEAVELQEQKGHIKGAGKTLAEDFNSLSIFGGIK